MLTKNVKTISRHIHHELNSPNYINQQLARIQFLEHIICSNTKTRKSNKQI